MTTTPPEAHDPQGTPGEQAPPEAAPEAPQYSPPEQPQYQAPPAGAYQQPPGYAPPPGYQQQPQPGYGQPTAPSDPANTVTLNYWLSVFFVVVPALIFYLIEKDKGDQRANQFHIANLNFSLLRTGWYLVGWILVFIPILGVVIWGLGSLALFILHIVAAVSAADDYRAGRAPKFMFNIPLIK